MVTLLSEGDGGTARARLPFGAAIVAGLLVLTNFLDCSALLEDFGFAGAPLPGTTGFAACALPAGSGLDGCGRAVLFAVFAEMPFFTGALFAAAFGPTAFLAATLASALFAISGFAGFFVAPAFAFGLAVDLRDMAAARATGFARVGAFAIFLTLTDFFLLFAIPLPIL